MEQQALVQSGVAFVYWQYIEGCDLETFSSVAPPGGFFDTSGLLC